MMYIKSPFEDEIFLSEVTSNGIAVVNEPKKIDIKSGGTGFAFSTKIPIFEPFVQSSELINKEELDPIVIGTVVQNLIMVPLFNESGDSMGVLKIINSQKSVFSN